jgi:hypothetical protein
VKRIDGGIEFTKFTTNFNQIKEMQLSKIAGLLEAFKAYLDTSDAQDWLFLWETQERFQQRWHPDSPDFGDMYNQALDNSVTRRLWNAEHYFPKKMMAEFIRIDADFVRRMFQDLFTESREIEGRLGRFVYHCDQLLEVYKDQYKKAPYSSHYHDDQYFMVSLYLSMRYPEIYAPYPHDAFVALLKTVGSTDIPKVTDPIRYFKVAKTLYQMMKKDERLMALHEDRLNPAVHYQGDSLMLIYECCQWNMQQTTR